MLYSPWFYIGIVAFVIIVNVWVLVRFLKKARGWTKPDGTKKDV